MKKRKATQVVQYIVLCHILAACISCSPDQSHRIHHRFDENWKFHLGVLQGAEEPGFDLSTWRNVNLPHDWSIEDIPGTGSPFDSTSVGSRSTAYTVGGTGWYIKEFVLDDNYAGKRVDILFEGVYMDADIWINGFHLGNQPYGYTSFHFDLTPYLHFDGAPNRIAVEVKNEGANCRWYSGSGIYRHVWLTATEPVHILQWGSFVSALNVKPDEAEIRVETDLINHRESRADLSLVVEVKDQDGLSQAFFSQNLSLGAGSEQKILQHMHVADPILWSTENP